MKKNWLIILIVIIVLGVCGAIAGSIYTFWINENVLTNKEKKWIDENSNLVISIAIPNDIPVFGEYGEGVFFDFIDYLNDELGLNINRNTVSSTAENSGDRFEVTYKIDGNSLVLYNDHFALVSKSTGLNYDDSLIGEFKAGVLKTELPYVLEYFALTEDKFKVYDSYSAISTDLNNGTLNYAIVPLNEYKEELVANKINVLEHFSDFKKYYTFVVDNSNSTTASILSKEFNLWCKNYYEDSYNKNNYNMFIDKLGITEIDEETLTNKVYRYGFAEVRPYEVLSGGNYGGVTAEYLNDFSKMVGVDFTFKKYKTSDELLNAAANKEIDLYYNYYDLSANYIDAGGLKDISYYVIADNSIDLSLSNISGLSNMSVYVLKDSYLFKMLNSVSDVDIITYDKSSQLSDIIKKKNVILVDEYTYDYYLSGLSNTYSVRLKGTYEDNTYSFKYQSENDAFYKLFNAYTNTIDKNDILRKGITTYNEVISKGNVLTVIAISILCLIGVGFIVLIFYRRNTRSLKLNTKIKKEDKLKYVDLLTSLKNRNYYSEKVDLWNKNTIYPQCCIVLDINKVKELNDSFGHEEGDRQILAVANVLIKTQIDNSEIMRTDGNEFLIYLVGYSEKQIVSYMKKIMKEFKKLPYDNGVAMGFSMIEDDTKLVEDAFNEASIQMRENKLLSGENNDK